MPFKLLPQGHRYWWPVTVETPDPEKVGKFLTSTFEMQFEAVGLDEIEKRLTSIRETVKGADAQDAALVEQVTHDWRGVVGEDGNEVLFTRESLAYALQFTWFRFGAFKALKESTMPRGL